MTALRIAVFGSGGVDGYFGARLAQGGADLTFIARGAHLAAMRKDGLRVLSDVGDFSVPNPSATDDPSAVSPVDLVMICVKLGDLEPTIAAAAPLIGPETAVVSFQNGVKKDDILRRELGEARVMGGVAYIGAHIEEPGVIRHVGTMQRLVFGEYGAATSSRAEALLAACQAGGIDSEISTDIRLALWQKFVFLVGLSGTTATTRQPIGRVREEVRTRALLRDAMAETIAVARAEGVELADEFLDGRLAFADGLPADMTSSLHHDLEAGNRLEIDWLAGDVAARGERLGVPTPVNRTIAAVLAPHADGS